MRLLFISVIPLGLPFSCRHVIRRFSRLCMIPSHKKPVSRRIAGREGELSRRQILKGLFLSILGNTILRNQTVGAYSSRLNDDEKVLPPLLYEEQVKQVVKTPSGLQYFDLTLGTGEDAGPGDTVSVHFTSRLRGLNGIKLDSSFDHPEDGIVPSFVFVVGDPKVVRGVSEMVQGMRTGGKRRAVLPPEIGYRDVQERPVPEGFFAKRRLLSVLNTNRDATIVFDIELLKVKKR